jgi:hypothetical protein
MIRIVTVQGNQPAITVYQVRAFKVLVPSINGAQFAVDAGGFQAITSGHTYEFQPLSGSSPAPVTSAALETNQLLRLQLAAQLGVEVQELDAKLGSTAQADGKANPKQYPTITFSNGASSMPFVVACDVYDGNEYVSGALGRDVAAVAQEWDQVTYGTSQPALNGTQAGVLGVPIFCKDNSTGRLFIPVGVNGILNVSQALPSQQFLDTTPSAGAAVNSGSQGVLSGVSYGHILVRVAGLTPASTRVLQLLAVRSDASTVVIASTTIGAAITDLDANFGTAEVTPAIPVVGSTTFQGFSFGGMIPSEWQINLTAGAAGDNPRVTAWARTIA